MFPVAIIKLSKHLSCNAAESAHLWCEVV